MCKWTNQTINKDCGNACLRTMAAVSSHCLACTLADAGTRALALRWLAGFVALARQEMLPLAAPVLAAVLPCIAHPATEIAQARAHVHDTGQGSLHPSI